MNRFARIFALVLAVAATSLHAASTIANLSSYSLVGASAGSLVAGIVIEGTENKNVLIRGVGPGLAMFGVAHPAGEVAIEVYDSSGNVVASNNGLLAALDPDAIAEVSASVGAFPLTDPGDAALLTTLAPGAYWIEVAPNAPDSPDGSALLEIYDTDAPDRASHITGLHTRGQIGGMAGALTAGFVVGGNDSKFISIRGIGPDLTPPDTAHNAANIASVDLSVYDSAGNLVAFTSGAFKNSNETLVTLMPGAYTVQVTLTSPSAGAGEAIVEIADADPADLASAVNRGGTPAVR